MPDVLSRDYTDRLLKLLRDPVTALAREVVEEQFARLNETRKRGEDLVVKPPALPRTPEEKGRDVARLLRALAAGRGEVDKAYEVAKRLYGAEDRVTQVIGKTLGASTGSTGGFLVPEEMAADVIELLRPASAVRQLNPTMVPLDSGTLNLPKITGGAAASYIGENTNAPKTTLTFGNVRPTAKKLAALVPISNDLIRRSSIQTDDMVRNDLVAALQQKSDAAFIRSAGVNGEPKGLLYWAPAANKFNANATVNAQNVVKDLGKAIEKLASADVRFIRPGWIFSHRTYVFLLTLLDANNNFLLREEISRGTLLGYPFARTSQVPDNLGTGQDESEIYFADFADVVVAEATGILLDASQEAAYFDGSNVVAAFSQDQTVIRAIVEHDLVLRHDESVAVIQAVKWTL